jgi:predicted permease
VKAFVSNQGIVSNGEVLSVFGISFVMYLTYAVIGILFLILTRVKDTQRGTYLFMMMFGNVGFMGFPVVEAMMGEEAMIYAAIYVALFQAFNWTFWAKELGGENYTLTAKKLLTNPAIISIAVGFACYALHITLPGLMLDALDYLANLNTGLSMFIMGVFLGGIQRSELKIDRHALWALFLRLLLIPMVIVVLFRLVGAGSWGVDSYIPVMANIIGTACPAAIVVILLSKRTGRCNPRYGSVLVALSTLLSLVTLPLVVGLAEKLL